MNKFKKAMNYLLADFRFNPAKYENCKEAMEFLEKAMKFKQYLFVPMSKLNDIHFEFEERLHEEFLTREARLTFVSKMSFERKVFNEIGNMKYIDERLVNVLKEELEEDSIYEE